jgi:hypothetical protein
LSPDPKKKYLREAPQVLDRLSLNFGPEKHVGVDKNRSEVPFRVLVMKQVMFTPNVVVPEFGNPGLGNTMVGFMERWPKRGIADARDQNENNPRPAEKNAEYEKRTCRGQDARCVDVDIYIVAALAMMLNGVVPPPCTPSHPRIVHHPAMHRVLGERSVK